MLSRLSPYFLLAALGLLFFGELVLHPTQVLYSDHSDLLAMHLPMKRFLVRSWQETGEIPLWCPYSFGGMPFIHDVQVAAFYPLHGPLYLLPETAVGAALSWLVVLHVVLAGWCMFAYAGSHGLGRPAALVAAFGYMFAGKWLLHVLAGGHYILTPLAWLPLVLLSLETALRRGSLAAATRAGAVFALIVLGTHPQLTLYAGLFVAVWSLGSVPGQEARSTHYRRWLLLGSWAALVAGALSAVQLLPALEAAPESSRAAGVAARDILAVAFPSVLGLVGPGWTPSWEDRAGLGVLWVTAAGLAPLVYRGRVRFDVGVCLGLLAFSLGGAACCQGLPGFRLFQIPVRMLMLLALPVALLAGKTTQALLETASPDPALRDRCRRVGLRVLAAAAFLGVASTVLHGIRGPVPAAGAAVYWAAVLVAAPVFLWLLGSRCPLRRRAWYGAWVACLLADAWALAWPQVAVRAEDDFYAPSAAVRRLAEVKHATPETRWRVLDWGPPGEPSSAPLGAALPLLGTVAIEPVLGYNSFDVRRYKEYLQFILDQDGPIRPREGIFGYPMVDAFPIRNKPLLDLLGVRYLLQPRQACQGAGWSAALADGDHWQPIGEDPRPRAYSFLAGGVRDLPSYTLFQNHDALPRAFVVYQAVALAERPQVLRQLKTTDFRQVVLLDGAGIAVPASPTAPGTASGSFSRCPRGSADVTPGMTSALPRGQRLNGWVRAYQPNRVVVEARAAAEGYLVLADVWFPGWACTVDGKPAPLYRANFLFRAVPVHAGTHEVVFTFAPASYRWGKGLSLLALGVFVPLGFGSLAGLSQRRKRRPKECACRTSAFGLQSLPVGIGGQPPSP